MVITIVLYAENSISDATGEGEYNHIAVVV